MIAQKFYALLTAALLMAAPALAQVTPPQPELSNGGAGDLLVAPTRVVLEGRTRASEIVLSNKGSKEATYRISFTHLKMKLDGSYEEITEADAKTAVRSADEFLRFSPRQVTLKPGEQQVVKVMVRKSEGMLDGEYTSHLMFRAVPDMATGTDVEAKQSDSSNIAIRLVPVYGVSIPVIVRQGDLSAQAKLESAQRTQGAVNVTISRTGTRSVFGDLTAYQTGTKNVLGQARGIAVLAYSDKRNVSIPLETDAPAITVEYREREEDGGKVIDKVAVP